MPMCKIAMAADNTVQDKYRQNTSKYIKLRVLVSSALLQQVFNPLTVLLRIKNSNMLQAQHSQDMQKRCGLAQHIRTRGVHLLHPSRPAAASAPAGLC